MLPREGALYLLGVTGFEPIMVFRNPVKSTLWKRLYKKRHDKDTIFHHENAIFGWRFIASLIHHKLRLSIDAALKAYCFQTDN